MIKILVEQGSEAWFKCRLGRITASNFAKLMSGESTIGYKDLIIDVAGEIVSREIEETYQNAAMIRGTELEPFARKEYENIFDVEVEQIGFCIPDEDNEFYDWIGVSPDGLLQDGLLEIKCPLRKTHWKYIKVNKLPNEYKWQVQAQLMVTDAKWCDFMSYYPGLKPFIIRVLPDLEMHEQMKVKLRTTIVLIKAELSEYDKYHF